MKSIHLITFTDLSCIPFDQSLSKQMDNVRRICNSALFLRKESNIRVRMPLNEIVIYSKNDLCLYNFIDIIKNEINVKKVTFNNNINDISSKKLVLNLKQCGQKFGKETPNLVKAASSGNWSLNQNNEPVVLNNVLPEDCYEIKFETKNDKFRVCSGKEIIVYLDTAITKELENEGIMRDIVRMVQIARKDMSLNIAEHIKIGIESKNSNVIEIISGENFSNYLINESIANSVILNILDFDNIFSYNNEDIGEIKIGIQKIL